MVFKLIVLSGPLKGQRLDIKEGELSLGRDARCSLAIEADDVAGEHAVIVRKGDVLHLRDLGSSGGTRVNDEAVESAKLKHGDVIEIGGTRLFVESARPPRAGSYGLWMVNQVLTVIVLIAAPIAFVCLVAYLEQTYLGLGGGAMGLAVAAPTNRPAGMAHESTAARDGGQEEFNLPGIGKSNAVSAPVRYDGSTSTAVNPGRETVEKPSSSPAVTPVSRGGSLSNSTGQDALQIEDSTHAPAVKAVGIVAVEERRFPDSEECEEMWTLDICLQALPGTRTLTPESVQVDVLMFDRRVKTGDILLTHALVSKGFVKPEGVWKSDERKTVKVTYVAPKELRGSETASGRAEQYFGYVIRVYYHGRLQDESARPLTLLSNSASLAERRKPTSDMDSHGLLAPGKSSAGAKESMQDER